VTSPKQPSWIKTAAGTDSEEWARAEEARILAGVRVLEEERAVVEDAAEWCHQIAFDEEIQPEAGAVVRNELRSTESGRVVRSIRVWSDGTVEVYRRDPPLSVVYTLPVSVIDAKKLVRFLFPEEISDGCRRLVRALTRSTRFEEE